MSRWPGVWWQHVTPLSSALAEQQAQPVGTDWYQFGDGVLVLDVDDPVFCQRFRQVYRECRLPSPLAAEGRRCVRCTVRSLETPQISSLAFDDPEAQGDLLDFSLGLFPDRGYRELPSAVAGWRLLASHTRPHEPFMAVQGDRALVSRSQPWQAFVGSCALNRVLRHQRDVLFFHAAAVGIRNVGMLLTGPKGSGKSTTSLTLASRGHQFLGDEIAAVRRDSGALLPMRRSVSIRPGPRAHAVETALRQSRCAVEAFPDGTTRVRAHVADIFPAAAARALWLGCVLFLRQFARHAQLEPFTFSLQHVSLLQPLSCTLWGVPPGRQLMAFLNFFSRLRCYFLDAGEPEETAECIESLTEELWV